MDSSRSGAQPAAAGVGEEVVELVAPAGAEADGRAAAGRHVRPHPAQHLDARALRQERHHVARAHDRVERLGDAPRRAGPARPGRRPASAAPGCSASAAAISTGSPSTPTTSCPTDARWPPMRPWPAARVQHARAARQHRVDRPGLAHQVHALGGEVRATAGCRRPSAPGSPGSAGSRRWVRSWTRSTRGRSARPGSAPRPGRAPPSPPAARRRTARAAAGRSRAGGRGRRRGGG